MFKQWNKVAALCFAFIFVFICGGCEGVVEFKPIKTADDDVNYARLFEVCMAHIASGTFEEMHGMLTDASKERFSLEEFTMRNSRIYSGIGMTDYSADIMLVTKIDLPEGSGDAQARRIVYRASMETDAGPISFTNEAVVYAIGQGEETAFLLEWDSHLIFPNLEDTDRVRVINDPGDRGRIFDRNGKLLAGPGIVKAVGFVPGKMNEEPEEDILAAAEILGMSADTITQRLSASGVQPDWFVSLKSIAESDIERKEKLLEIPGILIKDAEDRVYPLGPAAAHLVGYVQSINREELDARPGQGYHANSKIGKAGMESLLEERIRGIDGCRISIYDTEGNVKEMLAERPAVHGEDVNLTIDAGLQAMLYDRLKDDKSATVVMNPKTGEVLALMSTVAYDPNEFVLGMTDTQWALWRDDERMPMYNRFKASLVPGSSLKPIIGAIGLTTDSFAADENFGYESRSWRKDSSWGGYTVTTLKDYGPNAILRNALIYSDNIYFAKAALKIGSERLSAAFNGIGFNRDVPFEFGLTKSTYGLGSEFVNEIDLADSGYGQGRMLLNPVHMASIYTAFLNEGNMLVPYLEMKDTSQPTIWIENAFSPEAARTIREDMVQVVENSNGSAHAARMSGLLLAGKTGTAEIKATKEDTTGTELGWYVSYTAGETENPLLFVCMVEDVKNRGGSGYVLPIGKAVFEWTAGT